MLDEVRQHFELPVLVAANKSDLPEFHQLDFVDMNISTATGDGIDKVLDRLVEMIRDTGSMDNKLENI
jgi:nucleolar GTP-binding protein